MALVDQKRYSEAAEILREILPIREKVLGEEHPDVLQTKHNLSMAVEFQRKNVVQTDGQQENPNALQTLTAQTIALPNT